MHSWRLFPNPPMGDRSALFGGAKCPGGSMQFHVRLCAARNPARKRIQQDRGDAVQRDLVHLVEGESCRGVRIRLDFCRKGRIAMCVGRWIWLPAGALRARPAICGALGRASVNSDAANQRSPNPCRPFPSRSPATLRAPHPKRARLHRERQCGPGRQRRKPANAG